jgi:hypothetical protein
MTNRESVIASLARELGLTEAEALRLKKAIEWCEASGPQRYEVVGRIEVVVKHHETDRT